MARVDSSGNLLWTNDHNVDAIGHGSDESYRTAQNAFPDVLVQKINSDGFLAWSKALVNTEDFYPLSILETPEEDWMLSTYDAGVGFIGSGPIYLFKLDKFGAELWRKEYLDFKYAGTTGTHLVQTSDGGFVFCGSYEDSSGDLRTALRKVDASGEIVWTNNLVPSMNIDFETVQSIKGTSDGGFLISALRQDALEVLSHSIAKYDANGALVWETQVEHYPDLGSLHSFFFNLWDGFELLELNDGTIIATRAIYTDLPGTSFNDKFYDFGLVKLDADGNIIWSRDYSKFTETILVGGIIEIEETGGIVVGGQALPHLYFAGLDSLGNIYTNVVKGNVFHDLDENCLKDLDEVDFEDWFVEAQGSETFYAITDEAGNYHLDIDSGEYELRLIFPGPYWGTCQNNINLSVTTYDTLDVNFPAIANINCPYLEVDISTPFLRRCFENNYTVNYCNSGTEPAIDPYVEIEFDDDLIVNSASIPFDIIDGLYVFEIEDLPLGDCGSFKVNVTVDCDSTVLGQTHCVEAHIYPDSLCLPILPNWSGASLELDAGCMNDTVIFTISNVGTGDMTEELEYIVIEDDIIMYQDTEAPLVNGSSTSISFPATGGTFRLEVNPIEGHPGESMPSISIEGCTPDASSIFSLGFILNFAENDNDPFVSIDCQENRGAFDPNDKAAFPRGHSEENFIEANTDIEYKIRFQNTGTDTAFNIRVVDEIDPALDIASIRLGASSHPYDLLIEEGALHFLFDNIMLPDSNINEVASHGFIKFRIAQKPDNPIGTEIYNKAAIYFDFNDPIITNETWHTIGEDYILSIVSTKIPHQNTNIEVAPNPFTDYTVFSWEGETNRPMEFRLFNLNGQLLRLEKFRDNVFSFYRKGLTTGIYFYEMISDQEGIIGRGKVMVK